MSLALVIIRHMPNHAGTRPVDPVDRAHLTGVTRPSPPIHRYAASERLADLVERYWIPVWSLPEPSTQSTLQHPVCLIVVSNTYARFYGVARGRSSVTLEGDGWAVGTMFTPAAGRLVLGRSVADVTDTHVDLADVGGSRCRGARRRDPRGDGDGSRTRRPAMRRPSRPWNGGWRHTSRSTNRAW